MKKFRLKPLGDLRQKLNMNWFFIGLIMALCVSACSDDDNDSTAAIFPEKQSVDCSAGDTKEITFDATADWQLTSSATWCRFVVDGTEEYSLTGKAGKQTISIKITDEALSADAKSIAHITLMIGSEKAIIADVARNAKGLDLKIYDMEGNEIDKIEVGYNDYKPFIVKANFRFAATNRPEWVDIKGGAIVGISNKEVTGEVLIVDEAKFYKYVQEGTLTFTDEKGLGSFTFPLVYNGMDRTKMKKSGNQWNWEVSLDGKTITQTSGASSSATTTASTYNNFVPFTITAFNDDYVMVYAEKWENGNASGIDFSYEDQPSPLCNWIHTQKDKGNIRITFDEAKQERTAYVYALPKALFEEIGKFNLADALLDESQPDGLNYNMAENYLLMNFTQKDKKVVENNAFKISYYDASSQEQELTYTKVTDPGILSGFNTKEVYTMPQPKEIINASNIITFKVNPLFGNMSEEDNEGTITSNWDIYAYTDEEEKPNWCEPNMDYIQITLPNNLNSNLCILFKQNYTTTKVLIVTPN